MIDVPLRDIAFSVKEGDVIILDGKNITFDLEETQKTKKEIENMTKNLWQ